VEDCSCSGGGSAGRPVPASDGGADPAPGDDAFAPADAGSEPVPPEEPVCTCTPAGRNACRVIEKACTADGDCPSGWSCEDNPEGVCWSGPEGSGCEPADPASLCAPPYADLVGGAVRGEDGDSTSGGGPSGLPDGGMAEPPSTGGAGRPGSAASGDGGAVESGGCSLGRARGPAGSALVLAGLAALALLRVRRRARFQA
jgi:hypothetical protein